MAWGAFFIWWGLVDSDFGIWSSAPRGIGWLGLGLILLGLNAARWRVGIPVGSISLAVGLLAAALGGLKLTGLWPSSPVETPLVAILLLVTGLAMVIRAVQS
jgi:hypothetical protein